MVVAQLLAFALALPLGMLSAYRSGPDSTEGSRPSASCSSPSPASCWVSPHARPRPAPRLVPDDLPDRRRRSAGQFRAFFLPALTLALAQGSVYARILRTDLISTLQEDFVGGGPGQGPVRPEGALPPRAPTLDPGRPDRHRRERRPPHRRRRHRGAALRRAPAWAPSSSRPSPRGTT